jgi:hypothetical protein
VEDRAVTLLQATLELLQKCDNSHYVLNVLAETVRYDDAECDGSCLMDDIKEYLEERKIWDFINNKKTKRRGCVI